MFKYKDDDTEVVRASRAKWAMVTESVYYKYSFVAAGIYRLQSPFILRWPSPMATVRVPLRLEYLVSCCSIEQH